MYAATKDSDFRKSKYLESMPSNLEKLDDRRRKRAEASAKIKGRREITPEHKPERSSSSERSPIKLKKTLVKKTQDEGEDPKDREEAIVIEDSVENMDYQGQDFNDDN